MKVLVTGGSGFVGRNLIPFLIKNGYGVRALVRSKSSLEFVSSLGAEGIIGDLTDFKSLANTADGCGIAVHCAAKMDFWGDESEFYAVNTEGTQNILRASLDSGIRKFIHISAASVVNGSALRDVDESYVPARPPTDFYSKTKVLAEKAVLDFNSELFETVILRPPAIWGPCNPHYETIGKAVKEGKWIWIGGGKHTLSTIHVENLSSAVVSAIQNGRGGEIYYVTDGEKRPIKDLFTSILRAEGLDPGNRSIDRKTALMIVHGVKLIWMLFGIKRQPPVMPVMVYLMGTEFSVSDQRARRELGYKNAISVDEGIKRLSNI